jgi:opacity protein-like surface antigen
MPGTGQGAYISGTVKVDDVTSEIGRASIRIGTTTQVGNWALSPFFTASVYHEFAGDIRSNFATCVNCNFFGGGGFAFTPATFNASTLTTRLGTYGQYSFGVAGQLLNSGWSAFARVDYRNGEHIEGWAGTAGLRYNFIPEMIAAPVVRKGYDAPPPAWAPSLISWTGFYIGGHAGVGYARDEIGLVGSANESKVRSEGLLAGGQIGYNYQFANNFVIGIEGDASWADIKGARTCGGSNGLDANGNPGGFSPFFMACNSKAEWLASATGKLGYAWNRTLYYVKGGAAFTDDNLTANCILGPFNVPGNTRTCNNPAGALVNAITTSGDRTGWIVGFGSEFALDKNWSIRAEYDYIDFGSQRTVASDGTFFNSKNTTQLVKIGIDYRFSLY